MKTFIVKYGNNSCDSMTKEFNKEEDAINFARSLDDSYYYQVKKKHNGKEKTIFFSAFPTVKRWVD